LKKQIYRFQRPSQTWLSFMGNQESQSESFSRAKISVLLKDVG